MRAATRDRSARATLSDFGVSCLATPESSEHETDAGRGRPFELCGGVGLLRAHGSTCACFRGALYKFLIIFVNIDEILQGRIAYSPAAHQPSE